VYIKKIKMIYNWNNEKNEILKNSNRNISFENIITAIENKQIIEIIDNPSSNHNNQKCYVIEINNYVYLVPFVINYEKNEIFLKTIFPSRKHKKFYLDNKKNNEK